MLCFKKKLQIIQIFSHLMYFFLDLSIECVDQCLFRVLKCLVFSTTPNIYPNELFYHQNNLCSSKMITTALSMYVSDAGQP